MRVPVLSSTQSWYQLEPRTAVHVYVGIGSVSVDEEGATSAAMPGALIVNASGTLQGPIPATLHVWTHHRAGPAPSATLGVTEHVPVPPGQPTASAVYHWMTRAPLLSSTHNWYQVEPSTAFHVYVGLELSSVVEGDTSVAAATVSITKSRVAFEATPS